MKEFFEWVYSKDFSFWQNLGHLLVIVIIALLGFQYLINK